MSRCGIHLQGRGVSSAGHWSRRMVRVGQPRKMVNPTHKILKFSKTRIYIYFLVH